MIEKEYYCISRDLKIDFLDSYKTYHFEQKLKQEINFFDNSLNSIEFYDEKKSTIKLKLLYYKEQLKELLIEQEINYLFINYDISSEEKLIEAELSLKELFDITNINIPDNLNIDKIKIDYGTIEHIFYLTTQHHKIIVDYEYKGHFTDLNNVYICHYNHIFDKLFKILEEKKFHLITIYLVSYQYFLKKYNKLFDSEEIVEIETGEKPKRKLSRLLILLNELNILSNLDDRNTDKREISRQVARMLNTTESAINTTITAILNNYSDKYNPYISRSNTSMNAKFIKELRDLINKYDLKD